MTNPHAFCGRLATLQMLLHLPKFMNWVSEHTGPNGGVWPCNTSLDAHGIAKDMNLPNDREVDRIVEEEAEDSFHCIACLMKALIQVYWKNKNDRSTPAKCKEKLRKLDPLDSTDHPMASIHAMATRWRVVQTQEGILTNKVREERRDELNRQASADEFLTRFIGDVSATIDAEAMPARLEQFRSLFEVVQHDTWTCSRCDHTFDKVTTHYSFAGLPPLEGQADSVEAAVERELADRTAEKRCDNCIATQKDEKDEPDTEHTIRHRIEAAPEYLLVPFILGQYDTVTGAPYKNRNPIRLSPTLDLTAYQTQGATAPLRYRLIGVVYHAGVNTRVGHYVAAVTGPEYKFLLNDSRAGKLGRVNEPSFLTVNPFFSKHKSEFNAFILSYVRI
jgi:hypothetical protein